MSTISMATPIKIVFVPVYDPDASTIKIYAALPRENGTLPSLEEIMQSIPLRTIPTDTPIRKADQEMLSAVAIPLAIRREDVERMRGQKKTTGKERRKR